MPEICVLLRPTIPGDRALTFLVYRLLKTIYHLQGCDC
jgi:hypothetical protein